MVSDQRCAGKADDLSVIVDAECTALPPVQKGAEVGDFASFPDESVPAFNGKA